MSVTDSASSLLLPSQDSLFFSISEENAMFLARFLTVATLMAAAVAIPAPADAAGNSDSRQTIKSMPIVARPSRPGHFYGNTVRRLHQRRSS